MPLANAVPAKHRLRIAILRRQYQSTAGRRFRRHRAATAPSRHDAMVPVALRRLLFKARELATRNRLFRHSWAPLSVMFSVQPDCCSRITFRDVAVLPICVIVHLHMTFFTQAIRSGAVRIQAIAADLLV